MVVISSYDEWSQLDEVIVGHADGFAGFHLDNSFDLFFWENVKPFLASKGFFREGDAAYAWPVIPIEDSIVAELREDIDGFVKALNALGVRVRRPSPLAADAEIRTPFWRSTQSVPLNVRDNTLILGSHIVETAPHVRARLFENSYLKHLFYEYLADGARWFSMPRPALSRGVLDSSYFALTSEEQAVLRDHHAVPISGLDCEIVFDGAQCIRLGKDVLVNVANRNHELGFKWLQAMLGETFTFHRLDRMADTHIDSCVLPLRPGLWLVRNREMLSYLPEAFRRWDYIVAPDSQHDLFPSYRDKNLAIASKFIDMNVLSVNEQTVIVNVLYPELIAELGRRGFTVVPVRNRHRRLCGGGFHCWTLDVRRAGRLTSYA